jgi:uncharacterized oligopeptide transporter (OPT) family protein
MMSMPSSLIGFAIFKSLAHRLEVPFTPVENVLVQTVAVAVGSMPLSAGFVGMWQNRNGFLACISFV